MKKLVSIITPAYNASKTLNETFESVLSQTYDAWEWIVINDCSKDDTKDVLENLAKKDSRVVVVNLDKNGGAANARNVGIKLAKGEYIAFLDADDAWKNNKLEKQINFMEENGYDFTFSNYDVKYPDGKIILFAPKHDFVTYKMLLKTNCIGCLTVMYNCKNLGKKYIPMDATKREDHAYWLDITKSGTKAYRLNESLACYRVGEGSVSSKKFQMFKYQYKMYRIHEKFNPFKSLHYTLVVTFNKIFKKYGH